MTQTTTPPPAPSDSAQRRAGRKHPRPVTGAIPVPTTIAAKNRRVQPLRLAAAIAILAVFTVAGWWLFQANSSTVSVLGLRTTVLRGQTITAADLVAVNLTPDPQVRAVPVGESDTVIGKHAVTDLPAGILPAGSYTDTPVPAAGRAIIGVVLKPTSAPTTGLTPGAKVRLVPLPTSDAAAPTSTGSTGAAQIPTKTGQVIEVTPTDDGSGTQVDIDVAAADAPYLQLLAARDQIAVVVDSRAR